MLKRSLFTFCLMAVLGLSTNLYAQQAKTAKYAIQPQSKLKIDGNSTLHKWSMKTQDITGYFMIPANLLKNAQAGQEFTEGKVTVPVGKLDSGESGMNKTMFGAMKKKKYPNVTYSLTSAKVTGVNGSTINLDTKGNLTIRGTTKPIEMNVKAVKNSNGTIQFTGSKEFKMSEFGVKPPTKFFGTIKSADPVTISFNVVAKNSSSSIVEN